jgi:hypothetical protein
MAEVTGTEEFMNRLKKGMEEEKKENGPPPEVQKYAPPAMREQAFMPKTRSVESAHKQPTRSQMIAQSIIALPYRDAIAMGVGIMEKLSSEGDRPTVEKLVAAIHAWAWEWETWEDEQRPGS